MERKLKLTDDGSFTIYNSDLGECYHSTQGAIKEAIHTFIDAGLKHIDKEPISVLEIGFGTGLNTFLSLLYSVKKRIKIYYEAIEAYPLTKDEWKELNYSELMKDCSDYFEQLHDLDWEVKHKIDKFRLTKRKIRLQDYIPTKKFDVIYFDAFSPSTQAELWTEEIFLKMFKCTNEGGVLVTYSSKGDVKRALRSVGYIVERLPGYGDKHHMIRAIKP